MSESEVINKTPKGPETVESLVEDLAKLGVNPGMVLLVHSSLSSIGWVNGGAVAVILALEEALGPGGTLVMPTHSGDFSDPADWNHPPVPEEWKDTIRQTMPAFDLDLTPTRGMGRIPETFRKQAGVLRSYHPQSSFSAWGRYAREITTGQSLDCSLGDNSPLGRLYDLDARILLLGVKHDHNTSLHLAEFRAEFPGKKQVKQGAPLIVDGERKWVEILEYDEHSDEFAKIGASYKKSGGDLKEGTIGSAVSLLIPQRDLVDFAVSWIEMNWNFK
jgi:aminoglycoside 3-N-acetyltransferase